MSDETRVFEEKPFTVANVVTLLCLLIWVGLAILVAFLGPPTANSDFARMGLRSSAGISAFLFAVFAVVLGIVWLTVSFFKAQTIVCETEGFTIYSKGFWDSGETVRAFKWTDATGTEIRRGPKGSQSLVVILPGEELLLMNRTIMNTKEFSAIEGLFAERIYAARARTAEQT